MSNVLRSAYCVTSDTHYAIRATAYGIGSFWNEHPS
jgi:hypothetical protein